MELQKKKIEIAVTSFILALTCYLQYVAYTTKVRANVSGMQSMDFPKVILYFLMLLCVLVLAGSVRGYAALKKEAAKAEPAAEKKPFIRKEVLLSVLLVVLYAALWNVIGFLLSSFLFMFAESRLLDRSKPVWQALAVAAGYVVVVYAVFNLCFNVSFPEPLFEALLG